MTLNKAELSTAARKIQFLYTNIGRGHPFYLDGISEELIRDGRTGLIRGKTDVFEISTDVARLGWIAARWFYTHGSSSEGIVGKYYRKLRSDADYNTDSLALRILGRDLRRQFMTGHDPIVVAHPLLVAALRGRKEVHYQHGEVVTPREALVQGAETIFVPTASSAEPFLAAGYRKEQVQVTGLCIERALARQAKDAFDGRMSRLDSDVPLTGACFSSGAEPRPHLEKLLAAIESILTVGHSAIVFAISGGKLATTVRAGYSTNIEGFAVVDHQGEFLRERPQLLLVEYRTRRELDILTARLFPEFDFLVAPAHERTNWAIGLGLPIFVLSPHIGPFAPLNRDVLLSDPVVGVELESSTAAAGLSDILHRLRLSGELQAMAAHGWGRFATDGFARISKYLSSLVAV